MRDGGWKGVKVGKGGKDARDGSEGRREGGWGGKFVHVEKFNFLPRAQLESNTILPWKICNYYTLS